MDMHNTEVRPEELARAERCWANFAKASKIIGVLTAATLILMAIFLL